MTYATSTLARPSIRLASIPPPESRPSAGRSTASGIVAAFKHLWSDSWGPRLEHFLFHGVAALISREHATLIDLARIYIDDEFRRRIVSHLTDPETLRFWQEEFPSYTKSLRSDAIAPVLNKVGQIAASPQLRHIIGQVAPKLDLAFTMNKRRVLIANLAKGAIGEQGANLLGSLLISHLQLVAMERGSLPTTERVTFFAHIGEFQTFSSDAFASLLSEARKFFLHFALANQYCDQLSNTVRSALIGNAGTLVVFRVGSRDAELLAPEFRPMEPGGLSDQEPFTAWLRRGTGRDRVRLRRGQTVPVARDGRSDPRAEPTALWPLARRDRTAAPNSILEAVTSQPIQHQRNRSDAIEIARMPLLSNTARQELQ